MLKMKEVEKVKSKLDTRTKFVTQKYNINKDITDISSLAKLNKQVKKKINETAETRWKVEMQRKSSLVLYSESKEKYGLSEIIYSNSKASGPLADCRAGMLNTKTLRAKYQEIENHICTMCGEEEETMVHIVLNCKELGKRNVDIKIALGFTENVVWKEVNETKKRLAIWDNRKG